MADYLEGEIILVDKPFKWTSFDVVKKIRGVLRGITGERKIKVGHAGTLDPLATGLLIVCTGRKTKVISEIQNQEKEYEGTIYLGASTPSYDLETKPENFKEIDHLSQQDILETARQFIGEIEQKPPLYSAVKIDGKRAYDYARKGQEASIKSKKVLVSAFDIQHIDLPEIKFNIRCSKGTYIRSIANDFGMKLGVGAYLQSLRRTRIGDYMAKDAVLANEIDGYLKSESKI